MAVFFSGSNASRRSVLDAAGSYLSNIITDNLTAIQSTGGNQFDATFSRPDTGASTTLSSYNIASDELRVFVGGRAFSDGNLGVGGYGGYSASGNQSFFDSIDQRGQVGSTKGSSAVEFAPWGGQIAFNNATNWYFDNNTSTNEAFSGNDFYTVALHELGHVLGLGTAASWDSKVSGNGFTGSNAVAAYGGNVPLAGDQSHWQEGTQSTVDGVAQEALLDPNITTGTRKVYTALDLAALRDVGWQVDVAAVPVPGAVWLFGSALLGFFGLQRKQRADI